MDKVEAYLHLPRIKSNHPDPISYRVNNGPVQHGNMLVVKNAVFAVRPAGLAKVRREGRKNVHAFVRGELVAVDDQALEFIMNTVKLWMIADYRDATYNPYKYDTFVDKETKKPLYSSEYVIMDYNRVLYIPQRDGSKITARTVNSR